MNSYDPTTSPLEYLKLVATGMTQYEFDTFVVGKHHSRARLIQDLLRRKQALLEKRDDDLSKFGIELPGNLKFSDADNMIKMIDIELSRHDINHLKDLEKEEPAYWIDELARTAALEINTYGRIRPETMDKLMLLPEENFISSMNKASTLVMKLKLTAEGAEIINAPLPGNLPRT